MDIRNILGKLDQLTEGTMSSAKKKPTGPKFVGKMKGTDPASAAKDKYVGGESILRDLEAKLNEDPVKRDLAKEYREFKLNESSDIERKIHRTQALIQDYYNRARETRNDIRRDHFIDMARQLEYELDGMINDANQAEQDSYSVAQHDAEPSATWNRGGLGEGSDTEIDKKIEFHRQGQAAAQYKGAMNKMHAKKIRDLEAKKAALKQGVAEGVDSEELANEVYAEFERIYPNLARRADERTVHAAIMDVLNYGGDSNPSALAQDVARAVKRDIEQGVAEDSLNEFAVNKDGEGDGRSKLIGSIAQLLQAKKKVDFYVPGIRGHVAGIGGQGDWVTLKRWNKPYSKVNYSLALDSSDDKRFVLKMIRPDYYQVVQAGDLDESWVAAVAEGFSDLERAVMEGGHELVKENPVAPGAAPAPAPAGGKPTLGTDLSKPAGQQDAQQQQQDQKAQQLAAQKEKQEQATLTKGVNALKSAGAAVSNPNQVIKAFDKAEDNAGLTPADKNNIASAGTVLAPIMANPQLQGKFKDLVTQASAAQKKEQQQQANQPQQPTQPVGAPVAGQPK